VSGSSKTGNRSIARNSSYLLGAKVISRGLRLIYAVVLARLFGPELFGLFTYAQFWHVIFMSLAMFGTGRILSRQIGSDRSNAESYVGINISLRLLTSLIGMLGCGLLALDPGLTPEGRDLLLLFALAVPARSLASWAQQVFVAFEVAQIGLRQELAFRSLEVVLGLVALSLGGGLLSVASIHAVTWMLQALAGWRLVDSQLITVRLDWCRPALMKLATNGAAFMLTGLSLAILMQGGLILYKLLLDEPGELGQLAIVMQALGLLIMVPKSISSAALPVLSRWVTEGAGDEQRTMVLMLRTAIVGAVGLALLSVVVGPVLIPLLVGVEYQLAAELLGLALWLLLPLSLCVLINQLMVAHGEFWRASLISVTGALTMLVVMLLTLTELGIYSVFLGAAAGATLWSALEAWHVVRSGWLSGVDAFVRVGAAVAVAVLSFWLLLDFAPWLALSVGWLLLLPGLASPLVLWRRLRSLRVKVD